MSSNAVAVDVNTETELEIAYNIETNPGETLFAQTESERRHGASRRGSNKSKELNDLRA